MKIDYNARGCIFELNPETAEEYYSMKLIYDTQCTINTEQIIEELIKKMFKYTIDGKEVSYEEFYNYYKKLYRLNKEVAIPLRKFITVHKYDSPKLKASIAIDQIQAVTERDDGYASIRLATCKYDTCDKYEKIIKQLS